MSCFNIRIRHTKAAVYQSILKYPNASSDTNTPIHEKYAFAPTLTTETQVTVSNIIGATLDSIDDQKIVTLKPTGDGTVSADVLYTNIGFDGNNEAIDAKVHIDTTKTNAQVQIKPIAFIQATNKDSYKGRPTGAADITFVKHGTNTPVNMSGHLTFADVNSVKEINFDLSFFDKVYVDRNSGIQYQGSGSTMKMSGKTTATDDVTSQMTGAFTDKSTIHYSFKALTWGNVGVGFNTGSLVSIVVPAPQKFSALSTARQETGLTALTNYNKPVSSVQATIDQLTTPLNMPAPITDIYQKQPFYTIRQIIPYAARGFIKTYQLSDTVSPYLNFTKDDILITNDQNENKKNWFNVSVDSNHKLTIAATDKAVNDRSFYNQNYTFTINAQLDKAQKASWYPLLDSNEMLSLPNTAYAAITTSLNGTTTDQPRTSNPVNALFLVPAPKVTIPETTLLNTGEALSINGTVSDAGSAALQFFYTVDGGAEKPLNFNGTNSNRIDNATINQPITWQATLANLTTDTDHQLVIYAKNTFDNSSNKIKVTLQKGIPARAWFHYWDIDSDLSVDPSKADSNNPTSDLFKLNSTGYTSGLLGAHIQEHLPAGTPTIGDQPSDKNAPAPKIPGYQYLGYYVYPGGDAKSIWVPYNPADPTSSVFSGTYTYQEAIRQQAIAFIYRKTSAGLSVQMSDIEFGNYRVADKRSDFASRNENHLQIMDTKTTDPSQLDANATDTLDDTLGAWRVDVISTNDLYLPNDPNTVITGASLEFKQGVTPANSKAAAYPIKLKLNGQVATTIAESSGFGSADIAWTPDMIHLHIPEDATIKPGRYRTDLNWSVSRSVV
ncbi:isopeptide-forming domain-containing fimbrial protein [Agrilactobacillus fermenti]|uniref:isopeptide-forming domain-containing fimbrial protein n=1 Tax=Agrilactobacillus fermenti TaxID=2586909 RepID=UPI003A5B9C38